MNSKWEKVWGTRARELFVSFGDPLFIIKDEIVLDCNPKAAQLFGTTRQEIKGKAYYQLCPTGKEATQVFRPHLQRAAENGGDRFQTVLLKKEAEKFFADVNIYSIPLEDNSPLFIIHIRDITHQKETERKLKESEETLREFVENAPIGIFRTTLDGKILYANPKFREMYGATTDEEIAMADLKRDVYKNPEDRDRFVDRILREGKVENFQIEAKNCHGDPLWISIYARAVKDDEGNVKYLEGAFLDMTEEKRLEAQLQEIHRMEAIGTLVGGIAHEFNNILTGIIGYAELASLKVSSDHPVLKDLENIKEGARRAADLVRKLAAFGRKAILRIQKTDLNELVMEQIPLVKSLIPKGIDLEISLAPNTEPVEVDPEAVKEIIFNLCKNAIDAMPQRGTLTLETLAFTVDSELAKEYPWLEEETYGALVVRDTGRGIDKKIMPHIFEPFFTTKEVGKGIGLGLSMVYGLVKQHRGAILVKSEPGQGAEFTVLLPIFKAWETEGRRDAPLSLSFEKRERVVLLVEDEEPVRKVIRETLEGGGCQVLEASSGLEALEILHKTEKEIDLAILDLILPGLGGKEVSYRIKEVSPQTRILFISGYSPGSLHPKYRPEGETAFLQKPFTPRELLNKVGELMK
ncbi:MAG: hypothetical protein DRI91_05385 [Aquificota bacterium]|nr:MAG: hypothetical protein DRI91_05385 [Aquificota bacterium]